MLNELFLLTCSVENLLFFADKLRFKSLAQLLVVNISFASVIIVGKNSILLILARCCDHSQFSESSFELVNGNTAPILDVKKLECLCEKGRSFASGGTLLVYLLHDILLKSGVIFISQ